MTSIHHSIASQNQLDPLRSYVSPLASRNASPEMQAVWSPQNKHTTWRRLWIALAEAEMELGLEISPEQIAELNANVENIDFRAVAEYEAETQHDVMAHIRAFADVAPAAGPIIHLGATSQFVNCNTELIQFRDSLKIISVKLANVIDVLSRFALKFRDLPTLAFTHYQPAQPTTVGKRATLWAYDLALGLEEVEHAADSIRMRGVKGATGTQASFLALFDGDHQKVEQLDRLVIQKIGFNPDRRFAVTGQTYPRVFDALILSRLAAVAASIHKICNDIRLLANRKEIEEPFGAKQVGSSAMPYKRNPMRCERATGLARFVMSLVANPLNTAAAQWFERTLDDSANRRLTLPESFLALDGALDLMHIITNGLVVYEKTIHHNLMAELPFMATENIMMAATRNGVDRQQAHERIRMHSQAAGDAVKNEGKPNDLIERLRSDPMFTNIEFTEILDPTKYVGRAPQQVNDFLAAVVQPIRKRYADQLAPPRDVNV